MDPWNSAQDVVRCTLCRDSVAPMYCENCHIHLCKDCVEKHLSDSSKVHNVVSLKQYCTTLTYPKCCKHPTKQCELHCEDCDIPVCTKCISSGKHFGHKYVDIFKHFVEQKEVLQQELKELEQSIFPKYIGIISNIQVQKDDLSINSKKLTTAINEQGEVWHREKDSIVTNLRSNVEEIESKHRVILNKQEDEVTRTVSEIKETIVDLKKTLNSRDVCLISKYMYKSRNAELRKLPSILKVSLPNFLPEEIDKDQLIKMFGSLSALFFTTEEQDYRMSIQEAESVPPDWSLIDVPRVITTVHTRCEYLYGVAYLNDTELWTRGVNSMMKLYNLQGELVKSTQTKSKNAPQDIAVTRSGDLVYTDGKDKTVNIMKNTQIQTMIRLQGWSPHGVCNTSCGDLLVVMYSDYDKQTKVVRYSGSIEKQSIQFNDKGHPIYSSVGYKYISENRNLDICVSDGGARAVVVVNQAGKFRFTYTGPPSNTKGSFDPVGIATDSQSQILTADHSNHCIHILDQDGHFLCFIDNCCLEYPWGLCIDNRDNLFVTECDKGIVKKIQYCM